MRYQPNVPLARSEKGALKNATTDEVIERSQSYTTGEAGGLTFGSSPKGCQERPRFARARICEQLQELPMTPALRGGLAVMSSPKGCWLNFSAC